MPRHDPRETPSPEQGTPAPDAAEAGAPASFPAEPGVPASLPLEAGAPAPAAAVPYPTGEDPNGPASSARSGILGGALGAAGLIAVLTLASRAGGFLRWLAQSWVLGSSATADAYAKANTVPNVLYEIAAGGALVGLVVPLLAAPLAGGLRAETSRRASGLLSWTLLLLAPLGLLVALLARPIGVLLIGADAPPESVDLTAGFLRVFALQVPLYGVGTVLTGVAQAHKRFGWPAVAPLLSSLVVMATYVLVGVLGGPETDDPATVARSIVALLAWGTTAGVLVMSLTPLLALRGLGLRWRPTLALGRDLARTAVALAGAGIAGLLAQQVAVIAQLRVTSAAPGSYNVWQYAQAAYLLPYAVLAVPLVTAVAPRVAEQASRSVAACTPLVTRSMRAVLAAAHLGAGALAAVAPGVTGLFAARYEMPDMTVTLTVLALGLPGYALLLHATRSLYAVHRARLATLPAVVGWLLVAAGTVAAGALADPDSLLAALATASGVGMTAAGIVSLVTLVRALGRDVLDGVARTVLTSVAGAGVGAVVGRWLTVTVLGAAGEDASVVRSVLAVLAGGVAALAVWAAAVVAADRSVVAAVRRRR